MRESEFRQWLCSHLRLEKVDCQTIETSTGAGVPDVNCCWNGIEFWIETKLIHGPYMYLRPSQYAWATRRKVHGGLTFVMGYEESTKNILLWDEPPITFEMSPDKKLLKVPVNTGIPRKTLKTNLDMKFILG